jgi:hypothetical protein
MMYIQCHRYHFHRSLFAVLCGCQELRCPEYSIHTNLWYICFCLAPKKCSWLLELLAICPAPGLDNAKLFYSVMTHSVQTQALPN